MGILLTPSGVTAALLAGILVVVVLIGWNGHRAAQRKWLDAHQRMVSINRVEEGGLAPELQRVARIVRRLDKKLQAIQGSSSAHGDGANGGATNHSSLEPAGNHSAAKDVPTTSAEDTPFARPRRPLVLTPPAAGGVGGDGGFVPHAANTAHRILSHGIENTIFVSVASYRDDQCAPTILDLFQRAKRPEAIFVGAVEQHFPQDPSCVPKEFENCQANGGFCPSDHVLVRRIPPNKARGPTFGRFYGMLMYRGETYLFMMDSHNRFVSHWDHILVKMYQGLPTDKGVLSHYPEAWHNPQDNEQTNAPLDNRKTTTYLCTSKFIGEGFPRFDGFVVHKAAKPRPQPYAAAGFLFADARIIFDVPFDPHLNYIFDGEEILYSARLWTSGWDIFSPNENIMYHYYYRKKAKKFWSLLPHDWVTHRDRALRRIQFLLNVTKEGTTTRVVPEDTREEYVLVDLDKYGLGKERTLAAYYEFGGIDPIRRKVENKFCPKA